LTSQKKYKGLILDQIEKAFATQSKLINSNDH